MLNRFLLTYTVIIVCDSNYILVTNELMCLGFCTGGGHRGGA